MRDVNLADACVELVVEECHAEGGVTVITKAKFVSLTFGCDVDHDGPPPKPGDRIWVKGEGPWARSFAWADA